MKNKNIRLLVLGAMLFSACTPAAAQPVQPVVESAPEIEKQPVEEQLDMTASVEPQTGSLPNWYNSELTNVNSGSSFRVADLQGKVVLVETMAIWCSNCLRQQKEVKRLHQILADRTDFVSLGIDIDPNENVAQLTDYVRKNGFDWLYIVATGELVDEISSLYGSQYLNPPSTPMLIIDKLGEAHLLPFGIKSAEDLQSYLQPFFDEA